MKLEILQLAAIVENLPQLLDFVEEQASRGGLSATRVTRVLIALEEAFVNICHHAYANGPGDVWVRCDEENGRFMVEIADAGQPFDLDSLPSPEVDVDLAHRKVGGLGVFCMRKPG